MWFSRKQEAKPAGVASQKVAGLLAEPTPSTATAIPTASEQPNTIAPRCSSTKTRGDAAEVVAAEFLKHAGLTLVERNFRTPGRGGGEIDLIMLTPDGTLVFVEVRQRSSASHGGAGASIGRVKQQRIVLAAQYYLLRFSRMPACRFDVVLVEGTQPSAGDSNPSSALNIEWLVAAFDAF